jgi:hypothetical protein
MQKKYKNIVLCTILIYAFMLLGMGIVELARGVKRNMALYDYLVYTDINANTLSYLNKCSYDSSNTTVYSVFENFIAGQYQAIMSYSTNKGQTWTDELIAGTANIPFDPECFLDSSGNLHVTWRESATSKMKYRMRSSGGSWGSASTIETMIGLPHICVDSGDQVYSVLERPIADGYLQVAHYSGGSWSKPAGGLLALAANHRFINIAIQVVGTDIRCAYIEKDNISGNYWVKYAVYNGSSWSSPAVIDGPDATLRDAISIAANDAGEMYVVWHQTTQVWGTKYSGGWSAVAQITSETQQVYESKVIPLGANGFKLYFISKSADPGNLGNRNVACMDYSGGSWGSKTTLTTLSGVDNAYCCSPAREDTGTIRSLYSDFGASDTARFVTDEAPFVTPTVSICSPNHGPSAGGTSVTIGGSSFQAGATVKFGKVADGYVFATSVVVVDANTITCTVPAAVAPIEGLVDVVVTNPGPAEGTLTDGWTYGPTISSISPSQGPLCGGLEVTVTGTGLQSGLDITFNGELADNITYVDEHTATCDIPEYAGDGLIDAVVTNPDGEYYTLVSGFNYSNSIGSVPAVQPPGVGGNGYGFSMLLLDNAGAGTTSITVKLAAYTHYMVVANFVGGTGKVRVEVSNDETNFGIRGDITNDGYLELKGFRYLRVTVISGTVDVGIGLIRRLMWNEGEPRERSHYNMKLMHGILYPCGNDI